ncbi:hypothetical protein NADFUDRAFT_53384 [Nadsonia fulvescens var. elongata DSM 6958]|uniref:protein-histidine N-methyltransferase n=1 Tax=Nadsonia fulvescens var. elongata DSM 6958 TaxID=857566 RepID=A0A1E3PE86_9ASCO|nr:hypothetical protein NADFUDRAFT_53384 [Nadsonia fulvescens var. elongata DSM 6958]
MSFSFGFSGEDFEESDIQDHQHDLQEQQPAIQVNQPVISEAYQPRHHTLLSLLTPLISKRISYSAVASPHNKDLLFFRRDLFDVKHQLMSEDNLSETDEILLGTSNEDVRKTFYEGGLKSWECTFDLIDLLENDQANYLGQNLNSILEMGCGTGLPGMYIMLRLLSSPTQLPFTAENPFKLTLADYNDSVLRLVTAPNLLVAWASTLSPEVLMQLQRTEVNNNDGMANISNQQNNDSINFKFEAREGELEVTAALVQAFIETLQTKFISLDFISGAWSPEFVQAAEAPSYDLILASETIYQPETIPVFSQTMLSLMQQKSKALVAAKQIYFGVGGGIPEFIEILSNRGDSKWKGIKEVNIFGVVRGVLLVERII